MKKSILFGILAVTLSLGGYFWFRQQPAQEINRTIDHLLENVAHQKISLRNPADTREALHDLLAEEVALLGLPQLTDGSYSRQKIIALVDTMHKMTTRCDFTESKRALQIEGLEAQAYRTTTVTFAYGPDTRTEQSWDLIFDLEKQDHWRITGIRASPLSR